MFMPFEGYDPDNILQKEVYGQKDHVLIIGLEPVTEYFARVQVWNSAGRGPKGEWRRSETRHAGWLCESKLCHFRLVVKMGVQNMLFSRNPLFQEIGDFHFTCRLYY